MKVVVPARKFAIGWSNVALASATSSASPALDETVCVELYDPGCLRLVACDSYLLLHTPVLDDLDGEVDVPDIDDESEETHVVSDADGRMQNLANYLIKVTKEDPARTVTLTVERAPSEGVQMSLDGMDPQVLVVDADIEKVLLPIIDIGYPAWRAITFKSRRSDFCGFNHDRIGVFGKLKGVRGPVTFAFAGRNGMAQIEADTDPPLQGFLAPVRIADEIPTLLDAAGVYVPTPDEPGDDDDV